MKVFKKKKEKVIKTWEKYILLKMKQSRNQKIILNDIQELYPIKQS